MTGQLVLLTDPLRDDLNAAEQATVEARIAHEDEYRADHAIPAQPCRCSTPWGDVSDGRCWRCGRSVRRASADGSREA